MLRTGAFRLLTLHFAFFQLAVAMAGGFVGAYLLKTGFSLPVALLAYAGLLLLRFSLRFVSLALVKGIGYGPALMLGALLGTLQFIPLVFADNLAWLGAWIVVASMAESLYWPVYHAAAAVISSSDARGRELGLRTAIGSVIGVVGPLAGGMLLQRFGAGLDFTIAGLLSLASIVPLLGLKQIPAGPVPGLRDAMRGLDRRAMAIFATDGWMASGLGLAWPMILFMSLGSQYESFGIVTALSGLVGAASALLCGRSIDRGGRDRYLAIVCVALLAGFLMRSSASWSPLAASLASATGAAVNGLYVPVLMSVIYERAKQSGAAYRFHFAAEAGWDFGAATGCVLASVTAIVSSAQSLAVLPASLGLISLYWLVRGQSAPGNAVECADIKGSA